MYVDRKFFLSFLIKKDLIKIHFGILKLLIKSSKNITLLDKNLTLSGRSIEHTRKYIWHFFWMFFLILLKILYPKIDIFFNFIFFCFSNIFNIHSYIFTMFLNI